MLQKYNTLMKVKMYDTNKIYENFSSLISYLAFNVTYNLCKYRMSYETETNPRQT